MRISITKKPYIFVIFQWGVQTPSPPPLDPRMLQDKGLMPSVTRKPLQRDFNDYEGSTAAGHNVKKHP